MSNEARAQGGIRNVHRYAYHPYTRADADQGRGSGSGRQPGEMYRYAARGTPPDRHGGWNDQATLSPQPSGVEMKVDHSEATTSRASPQRRTDGTDGSAFASRYDSRATVVIVGMKGVGKTTLGLIANRTLGRRFIDTDQLFRSRMNVSLEAFVAQNGWPAFRKHETSILADLLVRFPHGAVIACGGGIVESSEARDLLRSARSSFPVIRVLREDAAIIKYIDQRWLRQYDEDLASMIERRRPLYKSCSSHTFYNLTFHDGEASETETTTERSSQQGGLHPLRFKELGDAFMRLLRNIFDWDTKESADDPTPRRKEHQHAAAVRSSISHLLASHGPGPSHETAHAEGRHHRADTSVKTNASLPMRANVLDRASLLSRRTTAMSFTFTDLTEVDPSVFQTITEGVDALEVRIDLLACLRAATSRERALNPAKLPLLDYDEVARQLETLRRAVPDVPILYTLRSDREGGFFHDDRELARRDTASPHSQKIYFELLEHAISLGVEMLDVELGWDPWLTKRLIANRGKTRIVPSYHDLAGALRWDSTVPQQLYERACSFGNGVHVVMMIGTTRRSNIEQNNHLNAFTARMLSTAAADPRASLPPLMALNMGLAGRSSRPFNDVLNFVSHPAMPVKAGRGQFSLKEMMEMLVRLSILQVSHFHLYGDVGDEGAAAKIVIQAAFDQFGLPYSLLDEGKWSLSEYIEKHQRIDVPDRDDEAAEPNSISDGLYIVGQAVRQVQLFGAMSAASPTQLSVLALVAQAVDVVAREDMAVSLLGTERGRHAPNSLGELRGPLVGCHTLPASISRVLNAHLAPINAPNVHRSALIVILSDSEGSEEIEEEVRIGKRSALFALSTMGFGTVYVIDEASHASRSRDALSRRASVSLPASPRESPSPTMESWEKEVMRLASSYANGAGRTDDRRDEAANRGHQTSVRHIGIRALSQSVTGAVQTAATSEDQENAQNGKAITADIEGGHTEEEDPQTAAAIREFERHPSKRPCAVVIVGGTDARQEAVMRRLWLSTAPSSHRSSPGLEVDAGDHSPPFVLPRELWDSFFGGTILRLPSKRSLPMGISHDVESRMDGDESMASDTVAVRQSSGMALERNGWINVQPWVIDRDRIERTVIESWTRRSAPSHFLRTVWQRQGA